MASAQSAARTGAELFELLLRKTSSTLQSVGWKLSFPTTDFCTRALRAIDLDAHFFQTAASNDR